MNVVNIMGNPEETECLGNACENATRNTAFWNLLIFLLLKCGINNKKWFGKICGILFQTYKNTLAYTKTFLMKFLQITTKWVIEVVAIFMFCHYCFLSLSCSSFWSIIVAILPLYWSLCPKKHRAFPACLAAFRHIFLQTFLVFTL